MRVYYTRSEDENLNLVFSPVRIYLYMLVDGVANSGCKNQLDPALRPYDCEQLSEVVVPRRAPHHSRRRLH